MGGGVGGGGVALDLGAAIHDLGTGGSTGGPPDLGTGGSTGGTPDLGTASSSPFIDTSDGIHAFLTFDYRLTASQISPIASRTDYVWGGESNNVSTWRAGNPKVVDTFYIPFDQDGTGCDLSCWNAKHPDWVLYQCDKTTPSTVAGYSALDLDISNPAVQSWQLAQIQTAASQGYNGIAFDLFGLDNKRGACGVWRNGQWVQLYNGTANDAKYTSDVLAWQHAMYTAMHAMAKPMLLIPNYVFDRAPSDPAAAQVLANLDGALDEEAAANWGYYITGTDWLNRNQWATLLQKAGKPYYAISGFPTVDTNAIQWALSTYLMEKAQASAIYIGPSSGASYGSDAWHSEYTAAIGRACGAMTAQQNVYVRSFATGLSVANPSSSSTFQYTLPAGTYTDLYGNAVAGTITLAPHSGIVLLKHGSPGC